MATITPEPAALPLTLEHIGSRLDDVEDMIGLLAETGQVATLARFLAELRAVKKLLDEQVREAEAQLAEIMDDKSIVVQGVGVFERRVGTDRRAWQWDDLLPRLTRLHLDPGGTGEIPSTAEAVEAMRRLIVDVIGVTPSRGPRVTALRALGLDPDEYAETTPGRVSVQITQGD